MLAEVLESERLLIRPFQLGDEQAMYALNSNPIVQKYRRYFSEISRTSQRYFAKHCP